MLEILCAEITSAEIALQSVADRIVFAPQTGTEALVPDFYEFQYLKRNYRKPIHIFIHPRGRSFYYSDEEFKKMKNEIITFGQATADGFVFGLLTAQGKIEVSRCREMLELAGELPCSFYLAADRCDSLEAEVYELIRLGFRSVVLPARHCRTEELKNIINKYQHRIQIIIGGIDGAEEISYVVENADARCFQATGISKYDSYATADEIKRLKQYSSVNY